MNANQPDRYNREVDTAEEGDRAIPRAMTDLASCLGDLETAARAVAKRIQYVIPGGSPFERAEKANAMPTSAPQPVRSHICDELHGRIFQLHEITARLNEIAKGIEL